MFNASTIGDPLFLFITSPIIFQHPCVTIGETSLCSQMISFLWFFIVCLFSWQYWHKYILFYPIFVFWQVHPCYTVCLPLMEYIGHKGWKSSVPQNWPNEKKVSNIFRKKLIPSSHLQIQRIPKIYKGKFHTLLLTMSPILYVICHPQHMSSMTQMT